MHLLTVFFLLLAGHALCDYPLQGDFLAKGKNQRAPLAGVPWYQCLTAHALIHAGAVLLITASLPLAMAELATHWTIDYSKSEGRLTFNQDQSLHFACKVIWVAVLSLKEHL